MIVNRHNSQSKIIGLQKTKSLYSIVTHSTAIEGSTVTEIENQLLFDECIAAKGHSLTELNL